MLLFDDELPAFLEFDAICEGDAAFKRNSGARATLPSNAIPALARVLSAARMTPVGANTAPSAPFKQPLAKTA